jgi:hypothetical protein
MGLKKVTCTKDYIYSGFDRICPYHQLFHLYGGQVFINKGKKELNWMDGSSSLSLQITEEDHANGGKRLEKWISERSSYLELSLVFRVLERLSIHRTAYGKLTIPEKYQNLIQEISIEQDFRNSFTLELDRRNHGMTGAIDDMLDLDEMKVRIIVTEQDIADDGKRLERLMNETLDRFMKKFKS